MAAIIVVALFFALCLFTIVNLEAKAQNSTEISTERYQDIAALRCASSEHAAAIDKALADGKIVLAEADSIEAISERQALANAKAQAAGNLPAPQGFCATTQSRKAA